MFGASKKLALKCQLFQCQFLWYGWTNQSMHYMVFCWKKYTIKTFHDQNRKRFIPGGIWITRFHKHKGLTPEPLCVVCTAWCVRYQTLYRRPPGNGESDASIAFWLRKGHSAGKPLPQLAIRDDATFFIQNCTKLVIFANKDPKTNFDACMMLRKPALSLKWRYFFYKWPIWRWYHLLPP